ncbi:MAG: metal ABC transporter permease [Proteobacteria bacterium]|nr:metal ABC transporter permease [Pseudomonadota bacterium]
MLQNSLIDLSALSAFFETEFARISLLCTLLTGGLCGFLSPTIVLKQRAYVGDTLAHLVFPGLVAGYFTATVLSAPLWLALMIGAVVTGLVGTILVEKIERTLLLPPDSAAVVTLTGFFAAGVVAVSKMRGTRIDLERFLFGDVLTLTIFDAIILAGVLVAVAVVILLLKVDWDAWLSDAEFALVMGFRVQLIERIFPVLVTAAVLTGLFAVGGLMMSALLALPAVLVPPKSSFSLKTIFLSIGLSVAGLAVAFIVDWPVGSSIVLLGFILVLTKAVVLSVWNRKVANKI